MATHTGERKYKCDFCDRTFLQKQGLKAHTYTHTGEKPYQCECCDEKFRRRDRLNYHMMENHPGVLHKCGVCYKSFASESTLRLHEARMHFEYRYPFKCARCKRGFASDEERSAHQKTHTDAEQSKSKQTSSSPGTPRAEDESQQAKQATTQKRRQPHHTEEKLCWCPHCDKSFSRPGNLEKHIMLHQRTVILDPKPGSELPEEATLPSHTFKACHKKRNLDSSVVEGSHKPSPHKVVVGQSTSSFRMGSGVKITVKQMESSELNTLIEGGKFSSESAASRKQERTLVDENESETSNLPTRNQDTLGNADTAQQANAAGEVVASTLGNEPQAPSGHTGVQSPQETSGSAEESSVIQCNTAPSNPTKLFQCGECGTMFSKFEEAQQHLLTHGNAVFAGEADAVGLPSVSADPAPGNDSHVKGLTTGSQGEPPSGSRSQAPSEKTVQGTSNEEMKKCAETRTDLSLQSKKSSARHVYPCAQCNKKFTTKANVVRHIRSHFGAAAKPFLCDICGRRFTQKWDLRIHKYSHIGGAPHRCAECGERFRRKWIRNEHWVSKHGAGGLVFKCEACGRKFANEADATQHRKVHEVQSCKLCSKEFLLKRKLKKHLVSSHGRKHPCKFRACAEAFEHSEDLSQHCKSRHRGKMAPFVCDMCGREFSRSYILKAHMLGHTLQGNLHK